MLIRFADLSDLPTIQTLAKQIWPIAYRGILSATQIGFMLNDIYSIDSLTSQLKIGTTFIIAETDNKPLAFASYSLSDSQSKTYKIHKLYILPEEQGKGIGKNLSDFIKGNTQAIGGKVLELNVNRNNKPAIQFYQKNGFSIFEEVDIPYYQFTLNDYIMRLRI